MSAPWTGGTDPGSNRPSVDGNFSVATAIGPVLISFVFEHDSKAPTAKSFIYDPSPGIPIGAGYFDYAPSPSQNSSRRDCFFIEQEFEQAADYFSGLELDTLYDQASYAPDYVGGLPLSEAILIGESIPSPSGNGVVRWTRTYCRLPGLVGGYFSRNEYEQMPVTFPGCAPTTIFQLPTADLNRLFAPETIQTGRETFSQCVLTRVQFDYFLVPSGSFSPDLGDNTRPDYLHPVFQVWGLAGQPTDKVVDPDLFGAGFWANTNGPEPTPPFTYTTPPKTDQPQFQGYLTAVANGWEICARGSEIKPWRGNIYVRSTWFSVAQ